MSRNQKTLMIGGALILIALLLVCGPLSGRFGGPASVGEPPSVAAGPPAGVGVAGAGAAGAIAGAGIGESELAAAGRGVDGLADETERCRRLEGETDEEWRRRLEKIENEGGFDEDCARWAAGSGYAALAGAGASGLAATAAAGSTASDSGKNIGANAASDATRSAGRAAAGVAGAGAAIASGTAAGLSGSGASGSGAGIGATTVVDLPLATTPSSGFGTGSGASSTAADTAALAANAFDTQLAAVSAGPPAGSTDGLLGFGAGPAGPVSNRFAPPVAALGGGGYDVASAAQPFGIGKGSALQPCDSPGSGCRNLRGIPSNPPIIPGGRPVPPANPPIIPGGRPTPQSLD